VEEREYLSEVCVTALGADKKVRFAGVMDEHGRLLVGRYRKDIKAPLINHSVRNSNTEGQAGASATTFDASNAAINLNRKFEGDLGEIEYQVTKFKKVKLVTLPFTNRNDRILCISTEPETDCQQLTAKLIRSI
jgi:hypothetical protein